MTRRIFEDIVVMSDGERLEIETMVIVALSVEDIEIWGLSFPTARYWIGYFN